MTKSKWGTIKKILLAKVGVVAIATAAYLGYYYNEPIERSLDTLTKTKLEVEEGYFKDGIGLSIDIPINEAGYREVYLIHSPSKRRIAVCSDMLPRNSVMLEGLIQRAEGIGKEGARQMLKKTNELEAKLYNAFE